MYLSPKDFARLAALSEEIADKANLLLDMAESETDEQTAMRLLERANDFMMLSASVTVNLDTIAKTNSPDRRGLLDRDPSLRRAIEEAFESHTKASA